jgi:glycosyltransferase involved in cell wall biosynthesis
MLLRLAERLERRGVSNVVVSLSDREPLADAFEARGIPVHSLNLSSGIRGMVALLRLRTLLNDLAPNVLQGWMYHANLMMTLARPLLKRNVPLLWNIRRGTDDFRERKLSTRLVISANRHLSSYADRIVHCTHTCRSQHEAIGFSAHNGVVIGNGFDVERLAASSEMRHMARQRYGVSESEILIGSIGRDDTAKGRTYLISALSQVIKRIPNARLMLVGRGMSEANPELRRLLVSSGVASRVILVGEYSPIVDLYSALDILCSSSVVEGFSNVLGEAMCCEVPCVATDVGNARELLDGVGIVVPPRSSLYLAEALVSMCEEGADARRARGARARTRISEGYSLDSVTDQYVSLYGEVAFQGLVSRGTRLEEMGASSDFSTTQRI